MLDNCKYNKIKLLHELCSMSWFIEKHAISDAKAVNDNECIKILEEVKKDLEKSIEKLRKVTFESNKH